MALTAVASFRVLTRACYRACLRRKFPMEYPFKPPSVISAPQIQRHAPPTACRAVIAVPSSARSSCGPRDLCPHTLVAKHCFATADRGVTEDSSAAFGGVCSDHTNRPVLAEHTNLPLDVRLPPRDMGTFRRPVGCWPRHSNEQHADCVDARLGWRTCCPSIASQVCELGGGAPTLVMRSISTVCLFLAAGSDVVGVLAAKRSVNSPQHHGTEDSCDPSPPHIRPTLCCPPDHGRRAVAARCRAAGIHAQPRPGHRSVRRHGG